MRKLKVLRFFCEAWAFRNTFSFFFVSWKCKFTQHATDTNNFSWLLFSLWQSAKFFVQTLFFNLLNLKIRRFFLFLKLDIWLFKLKKWQSIFLTFAVYFLLWISVFLFSIFFSYSLFSNDTMKFIQVYWCKIFSYISWEKLFFWLWMLFFFIKTTSKRIEIFLILQQIWN